MRDRANIFLVLLVSAVMVLSAATGTAFAQVGVPANFPTIQSAIDAVTAGSLADGTVINVQRGHYGEALVVANTPRSFTLRGVGGPDVTIVDAGGRGAPGIWIYRATGRITISGLTFRNAAPPNGLGGGFLVQESSPTFVNVVFEGNHAAWGGGGALITSNASFTGCVIRSNVADRSGGGIFMDGGARPVFTATDVLSNRSGAGPAGIGEVGVGGGVDARNSSPTFRSSRINGNVSRFAGGGIYHGGEFHSPYGVATLTLTDTEVSDNVSSPFNRHAAPSEGGGMHIEDNATAQLSRVQVLRNVANTGGGLNAYRARYDVVDALIDGNRAVARTDGGSGGGTGGGIHASSTNVTELRPSSVVVLMRSLVRNNTGITGGGIVVTGDFGRPATLSLADSVVDANSGQSQGGGILVSHSALYASGSLIMRNVVSGGASPSGGGISVITYSSATISNTTIVGNAAAGHGGGLYMNSTGTLRMSASRVTDNHSSTAFGGGGVFVGPQTDGSITTSTIADNTPYQLVEHGAPCPSVTYSSNSIVPSGNVLMCGGRTLSGSNSNLPRFSHVLAAPRFSGSTFTLSWAFCRAASVAVSNVGSFNGAWGSVDVAPAASTTYNVSASATSANGGNYPAVTVAVGVVADVVGPRGRAVTTAGDFDGDGRADLSVFRPSNGTWYHRFWDGSMLGLSYGLSGDLTAPADFDGDGRVDQTVWRPSTGTWYFRYSASGATGGLQWGLPGDVPVPADYDGDGLADPAVFRPSNGTWYIRYMSNGAQAAFQWGLPGDIPSPGDYDGDGVADLAVYRPGSGVWYLRYSSTGGDAARQWGLNGDVPVAADYDGDGRSDIAVFRPSNGVWYIVQSGNGGVSTYQWALANDVPVPGDFDGDGMTDVAVFRPSTATWYVVNSTTGSPVAIQWGLLDDVPVLKRP